MCILFVPVTATAKPVSFGYCLKLPNNKFMGNAAVSHTTNQIRKLFHNQLIASTRNEKAVKDIMLILDKHSHNVHEKHYIIKYHCDYVGLAKFLVDDILGALVEFPSEPTHSGTDLASIIA